MTKNYFIEKDLIDYRLKNKIIGKLDTSYTDEGGIREMIQMSEEILHNTAIMKEKKFLNRCLEQGAREGLATFGEKNVIEAIELGKVDTVLLSEKLEYPVFKYQCTACSEEFVVVAKSLNYSPNSQKCSECGSPNLEI